MRKLCTVNNVFAVHRKLFTVLYTVYTNNYTIHSVQSDLGSGHSGQWSDQ